MAERGWGSPSGIGSGGFDWGWGHPTPVGFPPATPITEAGWGSPFSVVAPVVVPIGNDIPPVFPDEGGIIIDVAAEWASAGPYRVRMVDADGSYHPAAAWAYSAVVGQGTNIYATQALDQLSFVLPPIPPGIYGIRIESGVGWSTSVTIPSAVRIVRRFRRAEVSRWNSRMPQRFLVGPIRVADEHIYPGGVP